MIHNILPFGIRAVTEKCTTEPFSKATLELRIGVLRQRLILLRPQNACVLGPDEDLTEDGVVVGTEDHLVIVDQADKFNSHFLQLFLNRTQSPRYRGQWLLMT